MFISVWLSCVLAANLLPSAVASTQTAPALALATYDTPASQLFKRAGTCPANTFQCSQELGSVFSDICCQNGQTCALDASGNPACCPSGAICTGTAPATAATGIPVGPVSYVPNQYFSFPYAATTYADREACTAAVSACSKNYGICLTVLEDGIGYGVTIAVPGVGGTTVNNAGAGALGASATPVCSSLSSEACSNLEATECASYGSSAVTARSLNMYLMAVVAVGAFTSIIS